MRIGLLGNSIDRKDVIERAVSYLNKLDLAYVIHIGNIGVPENLDFFEGLKHRMIGVFGPLDKNRRGIAAKTLDRIKGGPLEFKSGDKNDQLMFVYHGFEAFARSGYKEKGIDIVVHHETPEATIAIKEGLLYLNPGSLNSDSPTIIIAELEKRNATIMHI